jgi:hypothetical protein
MFSKIDKTNFLIENITFFEVLAIPNKEINKDLILEIIGNEKFIIFYDFENRKMFFGFDSKIADKKNDDIKKVITGLETSNSGINFTNQNKFDIILAYRKIDSIYEQFLSDMFEINQNSGFFAVIFIPIDKKEAQKSKEYIEEILSKKTLKETISINSGFLNKSATKSSHMDLFNESEETIFFNELLNSINNAMLSNNIQYKIFFVIPKILEI